MSSEATSTAVVQLARSTRYGKQLVNHLSRRHGGEWSENEARGAIVLQDGHALVIAEEGTLELSVTALNANLGRLQAIVGDHLQRFVGSTLDIQWFVNDGNHDVAVRQATGD